MSEEITEVKKTVRRERSTSDVSLAEAELVESAIGSRVQFKHGNRPRRGSRDAELNLSIPEGTIPAGMVGRWFEDSGQGEIDRAIEGWWGHVQDANGTNITRASGNRKMVLMAKRVEHHKEDKDLQMSRYKASIGEDADKPLGDGVESYTPIGEANKIKVTSDPFYTPS
jgi:hypothetical protein